MKTSMMVKAIAGLAVALCAHFADAQQKNLGPFEGQADVGRVKRPGSAVYNPETQEFTLVGSGTNMWFGKDEFHLVWKKMKGDFILQTSAEFVGKGVDAHRKIGWIVRTSLDSNATHINAAVHGDGLTSLQFRRKPGAETEEKKSTLTSADVIQLARKGNTYTMSVARKGEAFVTEQVTDLDLGGEVYVGLFVCSHNPDVSEKAVFRNVRIIVPARDNFVPYREYIGSNLEIMDVATGHRRILYRSAESLQAPNWTPDNKALIYNHNGLLYRFDLASRTPKVINTDFATRNNNDHVLSFDGKMLGISHHSKDDGGKSIVYTVPVGGGTPKKITPVGHSYLHGWSPDRKYLIYTGERNGEYDIYRIPSAGGPETRLTTSPGLDDGSEYSPDGKFIYFNSTRSGTMQIWRMKADGSEQTQMTNDEFNNWFPHVSPDGKWIVILSFQKDVNPDDHPFYKPVYLRLMPVSGGTPKVIAYVYGGQGTINTPSWSPDSKKVALVSNTDMSGEQL
ncbi:TolB family protein [Larkinella soli]|uniref:TolB family protein n=1 Tax=Larkinella soli TaxID=1770527 RepID=UPI00286DEB67|nr:biopolymer transporter TolR [Larkinella soli]